MPSEHDERECLMRAERDVEALETRALAAEQERDGLKLRVDALKHTPGWLARERLAEANIELQEARAALRTLCSWIEENVEETDKAVDAVARARAELERERER